jgi:8-oxo-dGTP diphosphatase
MPHIHTQPGQYDLTASAFIIRLDLDEPAVMLHHHIKLHRYMQFGGHVELHENHWQAVAHEIAEESGYTLSQLKLLQPSMRLTSATKAVIHPTPIYVQSHQFGEDDHYHTDISFAFVTDQSPADTVAEGESTDIKTFSAAELTALPDGVVNQNVREAALFVLNEVLATWRPVSTDTFPL